MAFYVASADSSGAFISGSEETLSPAPADVDYPQTSSGRRVETSGGAIVKQQSSKDVRMRAWVWHDLAQYPSRPQYLRFIHRLESLLSTTRRSRGLSPFVWLKDTDTDGLRIWKYFSGTATSASSNTIADTAQTWTASAAVNGVVEIVAGTAVGQRRTVLANTATALTVDPWGVNPVAGSTFSLQYPSNDFVRVRVLTVSKKPVARGGISYEEVRLEFVIDDPAWNALE